MEKISVIVPVYNTEKYLSKCVESIVGQKYTNLEIILVDDGSTDGSADLCEYWKQKDNRVVVIHKANGGLSSARNYGLKVATGEYIAFVDSDDWIDVDMYDKLYKMLLNHPSCQVARCQEQQISENKGKLTVIKSPKIEEWDKTRLLNDFFRVNGEPSNTGVWKYLINKNVLKGFSFVDTLNEDVEASYELCKRVDRMIVTNETMYAYVQKNDSITHSCFKKEDLGYKYAWERVLSRTIKDFPQYIEYAKFGVIRTNFTLLVKYYIYGPKEKNNEYAIIYSELRRAVIENFSCLMKKLPFSRRLLLIVTLIMPWIIPYVYEKLKK